MPRGQPFTAMCAALARPPFAGQADLHGHTTASDGAWSPAQFLSEARRAGLALVAITDHDTIAGALEAQGLVGVDGPRLLLGVEITARHLERDTHVLAYHFNPNHPGLNGLLAQMRVRRHRRHQARLDALTRRGIQLPDLPTPSVPGRRHLAQALADAGLANSLQDAFHRYRSEFSNGAPDSGGIPITEVLATVNDAGGKAVLAHPPQGTTLEGLRTLKAWGLAGVEAFYPDFSRSWTSTLKAWAKALGLGLTGGSDCHGPGPRAPGRRNIDPTQAAWLWDREQPQLSPGGIPCLAHSGAN